jgi:signal peptidase I
VSAARRGFLARLGIAALNLLTPGLGLLRTGDGRLAALLIAAPLAAVGLLLAYYVLGPRLIFLSYSVWTVILLLVVAATLLGSIVLSWRRSDERRHPERWWSRWYGILAVWLFVMVAGQGLVALMHGYYRPFYIPADGMLPTMEREDRILAAMDGAERLRRGDVVLVRAATGAIYVKRVAALAGDRIALSGGNVLLNGRPVAQRLVGTDRLELSGQPVQARRLVERLPGEQGEHEIYDTGWTQFDDFAEAAVRPGHVFLLGDNRDMSADSRVPRAQMGLEQVPLRDIVGRPLFFAWWPGRTHSGQSIAD